MMNQFDLLDWNYNDDSDLYEPIDLIKDYYDIMTDRLSVKYWTHPPMQESNAKSE